MSAPSTAASLVEEGTVSTGGDLAAAPCLMGGTPEQLAQFLAKEQKRWSETVRESGAHID